MTAKRRKSIIKEKTLQQLYAEHIGKVSDKWSAYLIEYGRIFEEYRNQPVQLLEIGVGNGGSLEIWSRFFPKAQKIVGCDISPLCARLRFADARIAVVVGDANSDAAQVAILGHAPTFDIIIDDGSHRSSDIVKSFARYFPCLAEGGVYIAEDLHCSYWRKFEGGLYDPFSSITFFKGLADVINHEHWGIEKSRAGILRGFLSTYGFHLSEELLQSVHSVQFTNSLCVVRKENPEGNSLNARIIAGSVAMVSPEVLGFHSRPPQPPEGSDQTTNEWTARSMPPGEELPLRIKELAKRDVESKDLAAKLQAQESRAAEREGQMASRDAEIVRLKGELAGALAQAQEKLAALEAEKNTKNQQLKSLEEKAARLTNQLSTSSRRIQMLVEWMESLEHVISVLLGSRRWKTGNMLGEVRRRLLRRLRVTMPVDCLSDIFDQFNAWRKNYQKKPKTPDGLVDEKRPISREPSASTRKTRRPPAELAVGLANMEVSVTRRLSNIDAYKRQIAEYMAARARRTAQPSKEKKIVIYTAISGNYDSVKLPERPDSRFDYVLFTDTPAPDTGIYQVRPITYFHVDPTRAARFVKIHPHILLEGYDVAIWIDSNIMILGNTYDLVEGFLASGKAVAAVPHPHRKSIYQELDECIRRDIDDPSIMQDQISHYRSMEFDHDDLIESNLMMFNLKNNLTRPFLDAWWTEIERYSKRDQLSLNYALKQTGIVWHRLMEHPNSVRNHPSFARGPHDNGDDPASKLIDALQVPFVDPYVGLTYAKVREQRIAAQKHRRIDIVLCVHNALEYLKLCLESIRRARKSENQRLIIIDDGSDQPTARYLVDFANSAPWIELHRNEQPRGYPKAANQGLAASAGELVILLNSDTIVTDGWAEKMADAVFSTPGAGIVGPMSSAASHQSIPEHRSSKDQTAINELPPGLTAEDMNRYCEQWTTADVLPRVPLVHGFCFGVTREVINKIGFFDAGNFPNGYGEENDYCFRAADSGFSLVVATHTYIFHAKSKSYATPDRVPLMKAGSETLKRLYGHARIERAVRSMQENQIFVGLRQRTRSLTEFIPPPSPQRRTSTLSTKSSILALSRSSQVLGDERFLSYDVCSDVLRENWAVIERFRANPRLDLNHALWVVPSFKHIYGGGINTIFRVADSFSRRFGTTNTIVLHGGKKQPLSHIEAMIRDAFPALKFDLSSPSEWREVENLPPSDAAFCTHWTTAYILARYNKCKGKFYFIQDFEPVFYAAGSTYGLIEQTYHFGFSGIANTPAVGELYRQYNSWVHYFIPGVDKSIFHPDPERGARNGTQRVVFYGRPGKNRNAFELGLAALSIVKNTLGDDVEIVSAGSDFSESDYGVEGIMKNLGVLQSLEEVAALYRSSDVGLVFMYTAHPSYQPFEFMASGCATVSNFNRYTQWFLRDGENAALADSTATRVAERILEVLHDQELQCRIVEGGLKTVSELEWDTALDRISSFVCHPCPTREELVSTAIDTDAAASHSLAAAVHLGAGNARKSVAWPVPCDHFPAEKTFRDSKVSFRGYDFVDFGCSEGGSFRKAAQWFSGQRGIGLDIDPRKVEKARDNGFHAVVCNITHLTVEEPEVRFVIASHFLEHLPSRQDAMQCLRTACRLAQGFVYIDYPYFDADGFLFQHGLKAYWSDWRGHKCHLTTLELFNILRDLKKEGVLRRFAVYAARPIHSSEDDCMHSVESPIDQHEWLAESHPPKPITEFERPVYRETKALIGLSDNHTFDFAEGRFYWTVKLYDSGRL